jgi:starvation-inducible DNA-binding protein
MHLNFGEFFTDTQVKIDLIAEQILRLKAKLLNTFNDYLNTSLVPDGKVILNDAEAIELVVSFLSKFNFTSFR